MLHKLRKACIGEEFDYNMLMYHLQSYNAPHRKITELLRKQAIIRVKKGLYVFGVEYRQGPLHLGLLANLIYGPSYVSKEYALMHYDMIPEQVHVVTNMTNKRKKLFRTPIGTFQYHYLNDKYFRIGIDWCKIDKKRHYLIATPEKALADMVAHIDSLGSKDNLLEHLVHNLRIDDEVIFSLRKDKLKKIEECYSKPNIKLLYQLLR